ncbi:MAG TPA: NAD(P)-binding domain-containing protein [Tepidimicrobium sp.]|nr:NAD(P)-binding domain-containing protein [Tepidimicrobium sp.]
MSKNLRYAVVGAGNGGQSMAGDLVLRGFNVVGIYDPFPEAIEYVQRQGGIRMIGDLREGFAEISRVSTNVEDIVLDADIIMVVVPAYAHEFMANALAPVVKSHQIIVLNPGCIGGTMVFRSILQSRGAECPILAETNILLYATRIVGPGVVGIQDIKRWLGVAALPASDTPKVVEALKPAFSQIEPMDNVLETGLNNTNPMTHVATTILNWGRTKSEGQAANFEFSEWVTEPVKPIVKKVDHERMAVIEALGIRGITNEEFFEISYGGKKRDVVQRVGEVLPSSTIVPDRYITEDVPMGLVPIASLADALEVKTPLTKILIDFACVIKDTDYWTEGRTLDKLGLQGLDAAGIRDAVQ